MVPDASSRECDAGPCSHTEALAVRLECRADNTAGPVLIEPYDSRFETQFDIRCTQTVQKLSDQCIAEY